jgi:arylsulfatase A-like enzyme/Tfp pilus assembly protein PilF
VALAAVAAAADAPAGGPTNLLLVTLDTTRADHVGAYGHAAAHTPNLDGLARAGALFENAFTCVPLTLPAHATLMTGLQPPEHGVHTNGKEVLAPEVRTLAEILRRRGYQTGAFVAAYVLNRKFGLDQGFEVFDDSLANALPQEVPEPLSVYRSGGEVVDSALTWLDGTVPSGQPFFGWVHLYDAHAPRFAHPELGAAFATPSYDGGIAYDDAQLGRLLEALRRHGVAERTLVVVVGDHGEGLSDHGEPEHGYLLNVEVLHVPLVIALPGRVQGGRRVPDLVSMRDVFPTVLDLLGVPAEAAAHGRSLRSTFDGGVLADEPSYAETDQPMLTFAWSPLRSLTSREWKYVRTPKTELYDRRADPREVRNLAAERPATVAEMERQLDDLEARMTKRAAAAVEISSEERRRLEALGYVEASAPPPPSSVALPDVKDMLPVKHLATWLRARLARRDIGDEAASRVARQLVEKSPGTANFQLLFGQTLRKTGRTGEAAQHFEEAVRLNPRSAEALASLGNMLVLRNDFAGGRTRLRAALEMDPNLPEAHFGLAQLAARRGQPRMAIERYRKTLELKDDYPEAHVNLANLLANQGEQKQAIEHYEKAIASAPNFALAHVNLGNLLLELDRDREALRHYVAAVRASPKFAPANLALGRALVAQGKLRVGIRYLERAVALRERDPAAADALAAAYVAAGRTDDGIRTAKLATRVAKKADRPVLAREIKGRIHMYRKEARHRAVARPAAAVGVPAPPISDAPRDG